VKTLKKTEPEFAGEVLDPGRNVSLTRTPFLYDVARDPVHGIDVTSQAPSGISTLPNTIRP